MAFTDSAENEPNAGAPGPAPGPAGGPPGGGPPGMQGGPILAALARRRGQMQPSAPGMGNGADSLMKIKMALDMIQTALPGLESGSPVHRDALRAVTSLSRHMPQGAPSAGVQQTGIQDMLRGTMRNALMQKLMGQGGQGGPGGAPGGGGPSPAPMPSQPLPGS